MTIAQSVNYTNSNTHNYIDSNYCLPGKLNFSINSIHATTILNNNTTKNNIQVHAQVDYYVADVTVQYLLQEINAALTQKIGIFFEKFFYLGAFKISLQT